MIQDILEKTETLYQMIKKNNHEALVKYKLNHKKYRILTYILNAKKCSPSTLSDQLHYDRPTITILIKQLEEDGWIKREVNQLNRRYIEITLTPEGERKMEALILNASISAGFEGMLEQGELELLSSLLNKLLSAV